MRVRLNNLCVRLVVGSLMLLLLVAQGVEAFSYDFSGIVLYDTKASNFARPGCGDIFTGVLELNDTLIFANNIAETTYEDFGTVAGGNFSRGGQDFFYALSHGDSDHSQMGMIWWSNPVTFRVGQKNFNNVYGLTFYLDGSLFYTPAQLVALRLSDFLADSFLSTFTERDSSLYYSGCRIATGTAFLGIIETPFVKTAVDSSAVPLPASLWFLGSGLLFLVRYRKH